MTPNKDQTGTNKEVIEKKAKADAELKKRRKSKSAKIAAGKKNQLTEKRNIKDIDTEKMASSSFVIVAAVKLVIFISQSHASPGLQAVLGIISTLISFAKPCANLNGSTSFVASAVDAVALLIRV